jgi:betaine-aldehyde dehydrogenase
MDPQTQMGPLAAERVRTRVEKHVAQAVDDGAKLAYGGGVPEGFTSGWYFEPTLFSDVDPDSALAQEEIFGPVFAVIPYDNMDEAVQIANNSRYGLCGAIYTNDAEMGRHVATRIRSGMFMVNAFFPSIINPTGGIKHSGFGRAGGVAGLMEFTASKTITFGPTQES